jgi:hypothetical protein
MATTTQPEKGKPNLPVPAAAAAVPVAAGETSSSAIAAREKAAVEARFLVAMNRPRNFDNAFARLMTACKRPAFAKVARYAKPVGGKSVTGLSIRFAEEAANLWGNIDISSFLVFDDDERRIYRTVGTDLETNATHAVDIMIEKFVERRQTRDGMEVVGQRQNSSGQVVFKIRATEDDLLVKVNNQIAKSRRNVILPLIPADVRDECEKQILDTMGNRDAEDPEGARKDIVLAFHGLGVAATQLVDLLGHPLEQLNPAELALLRSYYTALKDGEATWGDIAELHATAHGKKDNGGNSGNGGEQRQPRGAEGLKDALGKKAGEKKGEAKKTDVRLADCDSSCTPTAHHPECKHYSD